MSDRFEGKGEKSMAYLDCSVKSCTYNNEDGCCCKGDIQVEGREATEAQFKLILHKIIVCSSLGCQRFMIANFNHISMVDATARMRAIRLDCSSW